MGHTRIILLPTFMTERNRTRTTISAILSLSEIGMKESESLQLSIYRTESKLRYQKNILISRVGTGETSTNLETMRLENEETRNNIL